MRLMTEIRVDLPLPEGPMKPVMVFLWTAIVISFSTCALPKNTFSLSVEILVSILSYEYRAMALFMM